MIDKILSFGDIQKYQEKYDIPFTSSISAWLVAALNSLHSEGEESVELTILKSLLPKTYQEHPLVWINSLKEKVNFAILQTKRHGDFITVYAGQQPRQTNFLKGLIEQLNESTRVTVLTSSLPFSYQQQPYVLVSRLRKRGFTNLTRTTLLNKTIFTYVRNK